MATVTKISIITISCNNVMDIEPTLQSVISQDYPNIEYIVVDGASTDGTLDIIKRHQANIALVISEPDNGMYEAINKGIAAASGDIVGLIHAGDRLYGNGVISTIAGSFKSIDIEAIYGHSVLVDSSDRVVRVNRSPEFNKAHIRRGWMPSHQSIYMHRQRLLKFGAYRNDLGGSGDYEFFIRHFYRYPMQAKLLDEYIVRFSLGGMSTTNYRLLLRRQSIHAKCWTLNGLMPPRLLIPLKLMRKVSQFVHGLGHRFGITES